MLFYQVEAKVADTWELETSQDENGAEDSNEKRKSKGFTESKQWRNFKEFASRHSDELYEKSGNNTYICTIGVKSKTIVLLGIISRCEFDTAGLVGEYLSQIDAEYEDIATEEVTLSSLQSLLQTSCRLDIINDDDDVLELFGLDKLLRRAKVVVALYTDGKLAFLFGRKVGYVLHHVYIAGYSPVAYRRGKPAGKPEVHRLGKRPVCLVLSHHLASRVCPFVFRIGRGLKTALHSARGKQKARRRYRHELRHFMFLFMSSPVL